MKNPIVIILFWLFPWTLAAQEAGFKLQYTVPGNFSELAVDNLGNLFVITPNGQLKKFGPGGDSIAVFNNLRKYGKLSSLDVSNPLKVLLYYKEFQTIVILDRFLGVRATLDLRRSGIFQVKCIAQSYDNNIWVFDEQESKIKKIGDDGRVIDQSTDFRMLFDSVPSPGWIIDQDKQLYLYDPGKGVYIFDYYGGFRKRIQLTGWTDFAVMNRSVFGRNEQFFFRYEPGTLDLKQFPLPADMRSAQKIVFGPAALYTLEKNGINVYSYP